MKKFFDDTTLKTELMSYTMDYETDEIVMRVMVNDSEFGEMRLCEKDCESMFEWFELSKIMKHNKTEI